MAFSLTRKGTIKLAALVAVMFVLMFGALPNTFAAGSGPDGHDCDPNARMYNGVDVRRVQAGAVYTDNTSMRLHSTCNTPVVAFLDAGNGVKLYLAKGELMAFTNVATLNRATNGEVTIPTYDGMGTITIKPLQWGILHVQVNHPTQNNGMPMDGTIMWGHYECPAS